METVAELFKRMRCQVPSMSLTLHSKRGHPIRLDYSIPIQRSYLGGVSALLWLQRLAKCLTTGSRRQIPHRVDPLPASLTDLGVRRKLYKLLSDRWWCFALPEARHQVLQSGGASLNIPIPFKVQLPQK